MQNGYETVIAAEKTICKVDVKLPLQLKKLYVKWMLNCQ